MRPPSEPNVPAWHRWLGVGTLVVGMVAFTVGLTRLCRDKSHGLMPEWPLDLTFFHNLVWNVTAGHGYRQSATYHEPPGIFNETHFEPILLLAAPMYAVTPGLTTMFAVQAGLVSLGAIGVYRLARSGGALPLVAAGAGLVYLTWWPTWRMVMADIRPLTWSIPFLLLCAAALREGHRTETLLWGLLACFSREEVPLIVAGLGVTAWLWRAGGPEEARERRMLGIRLASACIAFLVISTMMRSNATFYIRPDEWIARFLSGDSSDQIDHWGREPGEMLAIRLRFLGEWMVPAGAACLLAPELLIGTLPLFVYLFSQAHEWAGWEGPYIHHSAPGVALIAAAAALGLPRLLARIPHRTARGVLGLVLLLGFLGGHRTLLGTYYETVIRAEIEPWRDQHDEVREAWALAGEVPADAVVMADYGTVHMFSGRKYVYCYQQEEFEPVWPAEGGSPLLPRAEVQPDWALVRLDHGDWRSRTTGAGLVQREQGRRWALYGPPSR